MWDERFWLVECGSGVGARVRAVLRPSRPCPACQIVHRAEENALMALLLRLEDQEVHASLNGESTLCLPHVVKAAELAQDGQHMRKLAAMQAAMLATLRGRLDELIRKHDYRFRDEGVKPKESVAWTRAIEALVGRDPLEDRLRTLSRDSGDGPFGLTTATRHVRSPVIRYQNCSPRSY